jgi:hypothetical protein
MRGTKSARRSASESPWPVMRSSRTSMSSGSTTPATMAGLGRSTRRAAKITVNKHWRSEPNSSQPTDTLPETSRPNAFSVVLKSYDWFTGTCASDQQGVVQGTPVEPNDGASAHFRPAVAVGGPEGSWTTRGTGASSVTDWVGAPCTIRTCDLQIRSLLLYPAELRAPCGTVKYSLIGPESASAGRQVANAVLGDATAFGQPAEARPAEGAGRG